MLKKILAVLCIFALQGIFGWGTQLAYSVGAVENGLVAYWSFDKGTVDIKKQATDVLNELEAVVNGNPELAPAADCKVGECLLFDGSVDYLLVEDTNPPIIDRDWDEITLECWVFVNALDDSWNRIISLDNMPTNSMVATLYYDDDDNRHNFWVKAGKGNTDAASHDIKGDIPTEEWLHLVGTYDGDMVRYYINGKLENKYSIKAGSLTKGGLLLGIGDRTDGCDCDTVQAYIDEVRIYERALSAAEVDNNFRSEGLAVSPSSNKLSVTWGTIKTTRSR